jgi:hypothetical protein
MSKSEFDRAKNMAAMLCSASNTITATISSLTFLAAMREAPSGYLTNCVT